jgi:uncharacterized damage-inducible protein DinB
MIGLGYVQAMVRYNRAMNERLYECSAQLTDAQRKEDVHAFFQSIHGTLNHLLLGDRIWMGRFTGQPIAVRSLSHELYADFATLRAERGKTDDAIGAWAAKLTEKDLAGTLDYMSIVNPAPRSHPLWFSIAHFFNHQTHHRGQVTTLLFQRGIDPGITDFLWLADTREKTA